MIMGASARAVGDEELGRPVSSLFWSAVAAGIAIMASLSVSGALHLSIPDALWRDAVVSLGYPVGFVIVVLGRMQSFTEQTVVAIVPLAREKTVRNLARVARVWTLVLAGNLVGTATVAALATYGHVQSDDIHEGMTAVAAKLMVRKLPVPARSLARVRTHCTPATIAAPLIFAVAIAAVVIFWLRSEGQAEHDAASANPGYEPLAHGAAWSGWELLSFACGGRMPKKGVSDRVEYRRQIDALCAKERLAQMEAPAAGVAKQRGLL
jgi:hypothetical protein